MSRTDKEAGLANKAVAVEPEAIGEDGNLSTKEAQTEQETQPTSESTEPETTSEPTQSTEPEATTSSDASDEDREHDEALRAQYDHVHAVAAAGGDNGENEV